MSMHGRNLTTRLPSCITTVSVLNAPATHQILDRITPTTRHNTLPEHVNSKIKKILKIMNTHTNQKPKSTRKITSPQPTRFRNPTEFASPTEYATSNLPTPPTQILQPPHLSQCTELRSATTEQPPCAKRSSDHEARR